VIGRRNISRLWSDLVRTLARGRLEKGYKAMAADEQREAEAAQWSEGQIGDVADEPR
jgi:hypothetical protein